MRTFKRLIRTRRGRTITAVAAAVLLLGAGLLTLNAVHGAGTPLQTRYAALGDSYASGPDIPTQIDVSSGCERSNHSYPVLVAARLSLDSGHFRDVSCSGATIADLAGPQPIGSATNPAQLSALTPDTTLITLGIGGNDLGFASVLTRCAELDAPGIIFDTLRHVTDDRAPCRASYTDGGTDQIREKIQTAATQLGAVLSRIHDRAPLARVLIVGYPDLLPAAGDDACATTVGITSEDTAYLNSEEVSLNTMLRDQATAAGDSYVDTYVPSVGHNACTSASVRWIEPLLPDAPAAPMHPNANGERAIADIVEAAITNTHNG